MSEREQELLTFAREELRLAKQHHDAATKRLNDAQMRVLVFEEVVLARQVSKAT